MFLCAVDGCGRKHKAKGYCRTHYSRMQRHGDAKEEIPIGIMSKGKRRNYVCTISGCNSEFFGRGYCRWHYRRAYPGC